jgi:pyruvate formate lyase activating enzyme
MGRIDFVAMDLKLPWSRYAEAVGVQADTTALVVTISLLRNHAIPQLRTTKRPGLTAYGQLAPCSVLTHA